MTPEELLLPDAPMTMDTKHVYKRTSLSTHHMSPSVQQISIDKMRMARTDQIEDLMFGSKHLRADRHERKGFRSLGITLEQPVSPPRASRTQRPESAQHSPKGHHSRYQHRSAGRFAKRQK